jgi:hypothetical protein
MTALGVGMARPPASIFKTQTRLFNGTPVSRGMDDSQPGIKQLPFRYISNIFSIAWMAVLKDNDFILNQIE